MTIVTVTAHTATICDMAIPPEPTIGDVIDANAEASATAAAAEVVDQIPPTTVVVEDTDNTTDPANALAYAEDIRKIAREEAEANMLAWMALAEANEQAKEAEQPEQPEVVVVTQQPDPSPTPPPQMEAPPDPVADEPPPREHPYYRPLRRKK